MAESNNNMKEVLTLPVLILLIGIVGSVGIIATKIAPSLTELGNSRSTFSAQEKEYRSKQKELENLKASSQAKATAEANASAGLSKSFYKPLESGMEPDIVLASEFNEILSLITSNSIKTRSVKYTYDPADDPFIKNSQGKYSVCQLDMEMIANYNDFKNFLKDLYKHDHYLDIVKVEVVPYQKNKSILLISLQLKLYAEKA